MEDKLLSLEEASALSGIPVNTLRTQLNRGHLVGVKVSKGKRMVWNVYASMLSLSADAKQKDRYQELVEQWEDEQASGYHSGKPIGQSSIDLNTTGLKDFWKQLKKEPDLSLISPENLKRSITSIEVEHEKRNCHYSKKLLIYKGVMSFLKILVRENLMSEGLIYEFKKAKPKRVYPPRKTVLDEDGLEKLLQANRKLRGGRSEFDVALGETLIELMVGTGLRRQEVIDLTLKDVDLKKGLLYVIDGKNHKDRIVGINYELEKTLRKWLKLRPKTNSEYFLVQESGEQITKTVVQNRIYRLAKANEIDITAHGLRRTFATFNSEKGIPVDIVRISLGHSKIDTTQGYMLTNELKAAAAIRGTRPSHTPEDVKKAILRKAMFGK